MTGKPTEKMVCPECGNELLLRNGKNGEFYGCSAYPECRFTQKTDALKGSVSKPHAPLNPVYGQHIKTTYDKPKYNPASQYVSYAKDVFLDLRRMIHEEQDKAKTPVKELAADDVIMERSCALVDIAIKHFT